MNKYAILINTCDSFEDCWQPYFKLHAKYWPDCTGRLYLNTETKDFSYGGLDITALKVSADETNHRLTWSECLIRAFDKIDEDIVLYMQEDYFIKDTVKNDLVEKYVNLMESNGDIDCLHLTDQAVIPDGPSQYEGLCKVKLRQRYRVSCQAALWRKSVLASYLRAHESAWQFEEFGSIRSAIMKSNFYVVDPTWVRLNMFEIIPYIFTGIVQGRWIVEVIQLFENNSIVMDFSLRGFTNDAPPRTLIVKLKNFQKRFPAIVKSYSNLLLMTVKYYISKI